MVKLQALPCSSIDCAYALHIYRLRTKRWGSVTQTS